MHSTRNWRIGWPTIWLWLFTAAVVAVAFMNWREHTSRSYLVNDDLPQLLRSTVFIDLSGTFHCGNKAVPAGLALGYEGMHTIDDSLRRPRLVDVTTVCIRPAAWNAEPDSTGRRETFAWLAERKTISKVRFSYPGVTADDLAQIGALPALDTVTLDYAPRTDAVWSAVGRLERLVELEIGKPANPKPNHELALPWWVDDDPAPRLDTPWATEADSTATDDAEAKQPGRFGRRELDLMRGLPLVRRLKLAQLTIDDDVLARLKSLEMLKLSSCKLWREEYVGLARCGRLEHLEIEAMPLGAFGAAKVAAIPHLRTLRLNGPVNNDELQALGANRTLISLELSDLSRLSSSRLAWLAAVPLERLKLRLGENDPAAPMLAALQGISTLRALSLDVAKMRGDHLVGLNRLGQLVELTIERPRLTPEQIRMLAGAMPRATLHVRSTESPEAIMLTPSVTLDRPDIAAGADGQLPE